MARYSVPQFIESEGKITPFLTFRQFFWLVGGGAAILLFYHTLPFAVFILLSLVVATVVIVSAFIKINNEAAIKFLFKAVAFSFGAKNYTWKRKEAYRPEEVKKQPRLKEIAKELETKLEPPMAIHRGKLMEIKKRVETKR